MGSCEVDWDCRNPNNMYPDIECLQDPYFVMNRSNVGPIFLMMVPSECGAASSHAPSQIRHVGKRISMPRPVKTTTAVVAMRLFLMMQDITTAVAIYVTFWEYCIDDYCNGECGVILLDAAGNHVTCALA